MQSDRKGARRKPGQPPLQDGTACRNARVAAGIAQKDLAARLGISAPLLCQIENGTHTATSGDLRVISEVTGVPVSGLEYRPDTASPLFTTNELAVYLNKPVNTIRKWRQRHIGPPGFPLGRDVMYRKSSVDAWLAEKEAADRSSNPALDPLNRAPEPRLPRRSRAA